MFACACCINLMSARCCFGLLSYFFVVACSPSARCCLRTLIGGDSKVDSVEGQSVDLGGGGSEGVEEGEGTAEGETALHKSESVEEGLEEEAESAK